MNERQAKALLDHVIDISRVEMYKPIQIAEVLRKALSDHSIHLADKETYRVASRRWRDEVTTSLFGKVSTSSARFQDDLWNDSAVPPQAMEVLGRSNETNRQVEAYIYGRVLAKSTGLTHARSKIDGLQTRADLESFVSLFDADGMSSSADRLFEIVATAVFQTELSNLPWSLRVDAAAPAHDRPASWSFVERAAGNSRPIVVDRLGRTNAADAGLDIWSNFGVVINVKRRALTADLLAQILGDTPVGDLHIVCRSVEASARLRLKALAATDRPVSITTEADLAGAGASLLRESKTAKPLRERLLQLFDHEFPLALTLGRFVADRGYLKTASTGIWHQ